MLLDVCFRLIVLVLIQKSLTTLRKHIERVTEKLPFHHKHQPQKEVRSPNPRPKSPVNESNKGEAGSLVGLQV